MSMKQAIMSRKSRRSYTREALDQATLMRLSAAVVECNRVGKIHIQMIVDDRGPFSGIKGSIFAGAHNYFVLAGPKKDPNLNEKLGYYGECLVLLCTRMGLGTCWISGTYEAGKVRSDLAAGEEVRCIIAFGRVKDKETPKERALAKAIKRGSKDVKDMLITEDEPENWVVEGVRYATLAPSAANRQPVSFYYSDGIVAARVANEEAEAFDLGIAKLHFEIGAAGGHWEFGNGGFFQKEG